MELKQRIKETEIIRMAALTPKTFQRKVTELEFDLPDLLQSLKLQHPIDSTPHKERPSLRSIYVVQYFPLPPKYCRCAVRDENFCESALAVTPALSPIIDTAPVFRPNAFSPNIFPKITNGESRSSLTDRLRLKIEVSSQTHFEKKPYK